MYDLEYLREFFKDDIFATKMLGAKIEEARDDYAKCSFKIDSNHMNAKGIVMGGAIFTLADFTFAVATNQHEEYNTLSIKLLNFISFSKSAKILNKLPVLYII